MYTNHHHLEPSSRPAGGRVRRLQTIRRRRITQLFLFLTLAAGSVTILVRNFVTAAPVREATASSQETITVIVRPGDSIWKIAKSHASDRVDIVAFKDEIARANHLGNENYLQVGQRLEIIDRR